jgi:hypothetical protein
MTMASGSPVGKGKRASVKSVVSVAAFVVLLAAVIIGVPAVMPHSKPAPPAPDPVTQPATVSTPDATPSVVAQAQSLINSGETTKAVAILESAKQKDPSNAEITQALEKAKAAAAATTSKPKTTSAPAGSKAVADIRKLLPSTISDFTGGVVVYQKTDAVVPFDPVPTSAQAKQIGRAVFEVHDRGSSSKATKFVTSTIKVSYPRNGSSVPGTAGGYFGTDGATEAVYAFTRGRFAYSVVVAGQPDVELASLKSLAVQLSQSFHLAP